MSSKTMGYNCINYFCYKNFRQLFSPLVAENFRFQSSSRIIILLFLNIYLLILCFLEFICHCIFSLPLFYLLFFLYVCIQLQLLLLFVIMSILLKEDLSPTSHIDIHVYGETETGLKILNSSLPTDGQAIKKCSGV